MGSVKREDRIFSGSRGIYFILFLIVIGGLIVILQTKAEGRVSSEFDHFRTGFPLVGAHERVKCIECHMLDVFRGTPKRCSACHIQGERAATSKSLNHIPTSSPCDSCHSMESWRVSRFAHSSETSGRCRGCHDGVRAKGKSGRHMASGKKCDECHRSTRRWSSVSFNQGGISGNCYGCHNGIIAPGKPSGHVTSTNNCEECHRPGVWRSAIFDHSSVSGSCFTCHDGVKATGKPGGHIATSGGCDSCHVTSGWKSVRFDHAYAQGSCGTCHDGVKATGKPGGHISSGSNCEDCHSTRSFSGATFTHDSATGNCNSCHEGRGAQRKPSGHFGTSLSCDECHSTSGWKPVRFRHSLGGYPGDHRSSVGCVDCHRGNSQTVTWRYSSYKPECAGCHAGKFEADEHKKVKNPRILYSAGELRDCAGSCHTYTDSSMRTIEKRKSGHHSTKRGGW